MVYLYRTLRYQIPNLTERRDCTKMQKNHITITRIVARRLIELARIQASNIFTYICGVVHGAMQVVRSPQTPGLCYIMILNPLPVCAFARSYLSRPQSQWDRETYEEGYLREFGYHFGGMRQDWYLNSMMKFWLRCRDELVLGLLLWVFPCVDHACGRVLEFLGFPRASTNVESRRYEKERSRKQLYREVSSPIMSK